jgi:hypothetical protein
MIKYFKKGCEYHWSDGCFAAGMKLHYHSDSITDVDERTKSLLEANIFNAYINNLFYKLNNLWNILEPTIFGKSLQ